jgi:hypothetical protein
MIRSPRVEGRLTDQGLVTAEADGERRRAVQPPHDPVPADQQRSRMPRVDPLEAARHRVEPHHLSGHEVVGAELLGDGPAHERVDLRRPDAIRRACR